MKLIPTSPREIFLTQHQCDCLRFGQVRAEPPADRKEPMHYSPVAGFPALDSTRSERTIPAHFWEGQPQ